MNVSYSSGKLSVTGLLTTKNNTTLTVIAWSPDTSPA
jgi:hypothetical protein